MRNILPLLLCALVLAACGDSTVAPEPAPHREIIYTRMATISGTQVEIVRALSDGSNQRVVTNGRLIAAPVNGKILFAGSDDESLYTGTIDGATPVKIDSGNFASYRFLNAEISPDGGQFLSVDMNSRNPELVIRKMDGSDRRILASYLYSFSAASFSPDGRKIAYLGNDRRLYTINVDGTGLVALTASPSSTVYEDRSMGLKPACSPNGEWIAMESFTTPMIDIVRADGGSPATLPSFRGAFPLWSSDGTEISCADNDWVVVHTIGGTSRGIVRSESDISIANNPNFLGWSSDRGRLLPQGGGISGYGAALVCIDIATRSTTIIDQFPVNAYWLR